VLSPQGGGNRIDIVDSVIEKTFARGSLFLGFFCGKRKTGNGIFAGAIRGFLPSKVPLENGRREAWGLSLRENRKRQTVNGFLEIFY
jgi:hypothetical protein